MIVYPLEWKTVGSEITIEQIEEAIKRILIDVQCPYLSLSGGLDSSLMLYYMVQVYGREKIKCFTMATSDEHPDYIYSKLISTQYGINTAFFIPSKTIVDDGFGNGIVKAFYTYLNSEGVKRIITGDGIDEFMCGYYPHQNNPDEDTYYYFLRTLYDNQLKPLQENSSEIKVILPYLDKRLILLLSQIPLKDKVDSKNRKKIMRRMASGKMPDEIIDRRKYGFCDAMKIK